MPARIPRNVVVVPPRPREGMSRAHADHVKQLPCLVCGKVGKGDPHHLMRGLPVGERGTSRRASDQWCIPACRPHHDEMHACGNDDTWLASRGIDGRGIAKSLWTERGDKKAMLRIIIRSLNRRGIYVS